MSESAQGFIEWQQRLANRIESELNRGSGRMWKSPDYVSPEKLMNSSYRPKALKQTRGYRWKKKPKQESLRYSLILGGGVRVYPDGREICQNSLAGRTEYHRRLNVMLQRQNFKCCLCGEPMSTYNATFEHRCPRGMAGSRRDDRIEDENGKEMNGAAHWQCNSEKGSKRI